MLKTKFHVSAMALISARGGYAARPFLATAASIRFSKPSSATLVSRDFHASASHQRGLARSIKNLFKWKKRFHPTDAAPESGRMTLFHQDYAPEDLRLPSPGDPFARTAAGVTDVVIAGSVGACVAYGLQLVTGDANLAFSVAQGTALAHWVFRDSLGLDGGNRSIGKRVWKQEIAYWDGTLASPGHAALRNFYFLGWPLATLHPIAGMTWSVLVVFDMASVFFTQDARKVGDYLFGTRVVNERAGRDVRLTDMEESNEIRRIRAEVERLSPGLLAIRTKSHGLGPSSGRPASSSTGSNAPADVRWYEDLQSELQSDLAREAREKGKAMLAAAKAAGRPQAGAPVIAPPVMPTVDDLPDFLKAETRQVLSAKPSGKEQ